MPFGFSASFFPVYYMGRVVNRSSLHNDEVLFYQRFLKAEDLYHDELDGIWGPKTQAASEAFFILSTDLIDKQGAFDERSERNILSLRLAVQKEARTFMSALKADNFNVKIISGTRSYAEQNRLYAQGRTRKGNIVTHAEGGESNHNFGLAWDIALFNDDGSYIPGGKIYTRASEVGLTDKLEWGGVWKMRDLAHYQLKSKQKLVSIRQSFEQGKEYLVA